MTNTSEVKAALAIAKVVGDTIKELGAVPSGHLYASLMQYMSLEQYQSVITALKKAGLVREQYHQLTWIGP